MNDHHETFPNDPDLQPLDDLLRGLPKPTVPQGLADRVATATADPFFSARLDADLASLDRMLCSRATDPSAPTDLARRIYYATVEQLQQRQLDHELQPLDAQLRQALRADPPTDLADRLFEKTLYQLSAQSEPPSRAVLARLGFERVIWFGAMAATWAFAIGAAIWFQALDNTTPDPFEVAIPTRQPIPVEAKTPATEIANHADVVEAPLVIDTDMELMALAVEIDQLEMDVATGVDPIESELNQLMRQLDEGLF